MKPTKTNISEYLNYSTISFGTSLLATVVSTYILYYYTDVLLLPLELISILLFAGRFFDGAVDPVIGFYMDRRHTKFGKYRGYIIFWAIPTCIFFAAMFMPFRLTGTALVIYCFITYLFWAFAQSMVECAHSTMLITLNDNPKQRRMTNTVRIALSILAALAASYLPLILVGKLGGGSERSGFTITMALFALITLAVILHGALKLKERNITQDNTLSVKKTVLALINDKRLLLLFLMYMSNQIGSTVKSQAIVFYIKYNLNRADLTAIIMMTGILSSFLAQPLIIWASKRIKIITLILAGYIGACLSLVVMGISGQSIVLLFIGNILYGITSAFPANLIFVYTADLAEGISKQHSFGGLVSSLLGLSSRIGLSLSGIIISVILTNTGYVPNVQQSPAALTGIWVCLIVPTFLAFSIAAIMSCVSRGRLKKQH